MFSFLNRGGPIFGEFMKCSNRRGHAGLHLTSPSFNVMGEAKDTAAQVEAVRNRFPDSSYLAMVGISAGSGLLVTYLGKVSLVNFHDFLKLRSATV